MVKKFVIGMLLVGFAMASQADAQIFRRWGAPSGFQAQQRYGQQYQSQCQQQQELLRQQMLRMKQQEQPGLATDRKKEAEETEQANPVQVQRAQLELLRQRQLLSQLQETLERQQQLAKSGMLRNRADYRVAIQRQLERQKQIVEIAENASKSLAKQPVAPGFRDVVKSGSAQRDLAREQAVKMPTLAGPTGSVAPNASVPQVAQQPKPVALIEPAETLPASAVRKDSAVVPASGVEAENPSEAISILQAPVGNSVLETTEDPGSLGKLKLDGPASDK